VSRCEYILWLTFVTTKFLLNIMIAAIESLLESLLDLLDLSPCYRTYQCLLSIDSPVCRLLNICYIHFAFTVFLVLTLLLNFLLR